MGNRSLAIGAIDENIKLAIAEMQSRSGGGQVYLVLAETIAFLEMAGRSPAERDQVINAHVNTALDLLNESRISRAMDHAMLARTTALRDLLRSGRWPR